MRHVRAISALLLVVAAGCPSDDTSATTTSDTAPVTGQAIPSTTTVPSDDTADDPTSTNDGTRVAIETTAGTFVLQLEDERAPATTNNFLAYVEAGFYDGSDGLEPTTIHRVVPGYVLQGGGLTEDLDAKATMPPVVNEAGNGLAHVRGAVGMARIPDEPDSTTSQFFVNLVDNPDLDVPPGFVVFGQVVEGMEVIDAIAQVATTDVPPHEDVPVEPILVTSTTVL